MKKIGVGCEGGGRQLGLGRLVQGRHDDWVLTSSSSTADENFDGRNSARGREGGREG